MQATLIAYLFAHQKLSLPGIGSFAIEYVPARFNFANKQLQPPFPVVRFSMEHAMPDNHFYDFVCNQLQLDQATAINKHNEYCYQLKSNLQQHKKVHLPGLGTLNREFANTYTFQSDVDVEQLYPTIAIERIIRENTTHAVTVGDKEFSNTEMKVILQDEVTSTEKWWWWAVALTIVALIPILIYHFA
ncbi:MAG: hypothetical protein ACK4HE_09110 [Chitinophagaceae bacterium]|jgi:nucleoid DNA-binding protein